MELFYESPLYALAAGVPLCVILVAIWFQTGTHKLLIATLAVATVTIGLVFMESAVKTPRERIYETIFAIADAVEKEDFETAVGYVSPESEIVRSQALNELNKYEISSISVKNNLVVVFDNSTAPLTARTGFNVVVKGSARQLGINNQTVPRYLEVTFQYHATNDAWYVKSYGHTDIREGIQIEKRLREQRDN
ncbi:MAG: hypothetical protein CMJ76_08720 [Planctomycetaceae bacterium]|nr:hypothetical protein [Planctomycetaceae bacterium]